MPFVPRLLDDRSWQSKVCAREIPAPTAHFASLIREEVMPVLEALSGSSANHRPAPPRPRPVALRHKHHRALPDADGHRSRPVEPDASDPAARRRRPEEPP
ncbi:hypothetical protein ACPA9J_27255 [Pseudomonas aeruginosa]